MGYNNEKTTVAGWTVPQVESIGTLAVKTNHPRGFLVVDTVTGQVQRGARHEFALRSNLRVEDVRALVQIANQEAKKAGISGVNTAPPLPTTITIPGNGPMDICDLSDEAISFALALEGSKFQGTTSPIYKALKAEQTARG